ncbi:phosphatidylglycerophosphatase A [uncultured Limosilactobacillus sp.]|uniref:phosphatidylglycerophosphatase A family protein n=1 Tax=uncultured Limosilactobacillus sp. TaxID=2837629 RepID=UPI0025EA51B8|nr:phosphatidylglycerophosphatase A [uncultured Limosilactobacillus sp.]
MQNTNFKYPDTKAFNFVVDRLKARGVTINDLVDLTYNLQAEFIPNLTHEECENAVIDVMHKREFLNNAMVGLELDRLTENHQVAEPLASIIANDAGVFGVDEALALQIAELYGTIGITNFGYLDRVKSGIIKKFDTDGQHVNTFIDDLLGAIVAAACGKLAHQEA